MALYTFVPPVGPVAASTYYLPKTSGDFKSSLLLNQGGSSNSSFTGATGQYIGSGTGPMFPTGGTITATFNISPYWLTSTNPNGAYTKDIAGAENALADFDKAVFMGGLGLLTDRWWTGSIWDTKTCTAIVHAAPTITRLASGLKITIDVELLCPSAHWTASDGVTLTMFR